MILELLHPWALALLPLAALPMLRHPQRVTGYSWLGLLVEDAPSRWVDRGLRIAGTLVPAFRQNVSITHDYTTHPRVGCGGVHSFGSQP